MAIPLALIAIMAAVGAGIGGAKGGAKGALIGGALGAGAGFGLPALGALGAGAGGLGAAGAGAGALGAGAASATPALGPGLMAMSGAATSAGVGAAAPAAAGAAAPAAAGGGMMPYLGIASKAMSPGLQGMLGGNKQSPRYPSATPTNTGAKSGWNVNSFYPPPRQRTPASLARLLMGMNR